MARSESERTSKSRVVRLGNRDIEVVAEGVSLSFWADISHRSMTASWPAFIGGAVLVFVAFNAVFASLFWIGDQPISNVPSGAYIDYLYFSIETLSTAGYGDISADPLWAFYLRRGALHGHLFDVADDRTNLCAVLTAKRPAAVRRPPGHFKP